MRSLKKCALYAILAMVASLFAGVSPSSVFAEEKGNVVLKSTAMIGTISHVGSDLSGTSAQIVNWGFFVDPGTCTMNQPGYLGVRGSKPLSFKVKNVDKDHLTTSILTVVLPTVVRLERGSSGSVDIQSFKATSDLTINQKTYDRRGILLKERSINSNAKIFIRAETQSKKVFVKIESSVIGLMPIIRGFKFNVHFENYLYVEKLICPKLSTSPTPVPTP